ncbi:DUF2818 family protein [Leeia sp. TBRC 13508]|uniref:DUF2818 family protein n=1 Tax=Leeia speluncae TaxID=2884804 RepID=A0ABS8D263_9NEIS|nr:DUF2818 family protein [Leeia speluncae]MCB6182288.1 DUF2818 family protein [Leeia speluncae]
MKVGADLTFWVFLVLSFIIANAAFFTERLLGILKTTTLNHVVVFILNFVASFFFLAGVSYLFETTYSVHQSQNWQFYASAVCFYFILATPGFVIKKLQK